MPEKDAAFPVRWNKRLEVPKLETERRYQADDETVNNRLGKVVVDKHVLEVLHGRREVKTAYSYSVCRRSFKRKPGTSRTWEREQKEENNNYDVKEYSSSNPSGSGFRYIFSH